MIKLDDLSWWEIGIWPWPIRTIIISAACLGLASVLYVVLKQEQQEIECHINHHDENLADYNIGRVREKLEEFPLEHLKMVGTLKNSRSISALILDNSGMIHMVQVGCYIGKNSGEIISISHAEILVEQKEDYIPQTTTIKIKQ